MSAQGSARRGRAVAFAWSMLIAAVIGCNDSATAPSEPQATMEISPRFQALGEAYQVAPGQRVAVRLRRLSGALAADTVFTVGTGNGPLQLAIPVRVAGERETMRLTLAILGPSGDTLFTAGPLDVVAVSDRAPPGPEGPPVAAITLTYVGPGAATMQRVAFAVRDTAVSVGDSAQLVATAFTQAQTPIAGVLFAYRSLDTARVRVRPSGVVVAGTVRGPALVEVRSFTGLADTARVVVQPRPVAVRLVAGTGQSGTVARALSVPLAVRVVAADSLGVRGVAVRFGPAGVARDSVVFTDSTGAAQTIATLPTTAGAGVATATVAAVGGAPTNFAFTAVADTATTLVVASAPTAVAAGVVFPTVTVDARDAFGNRATSFARTVTVALTTNPTGATLGGTVVRTAAAGVASFGDLTVTAAGGGYVLGASAAGVAGGVSAPLAITAGPPAAVALVRGADQLGNPGIPLADSVQVRVRDAFGNNIAGTSVAFAVTAGAGTVGAPTATTDANGLAAVRWTMGAPFGDATLTATAGSVSTNALAVVVPVGTTRVWSGASSTAWTTAANWIPLGVPTTTDVLAIAPKPNQPQLAAATTIAALSVLPAATVTLGASLRVQGSVAVDGAVTGASPLVLAAPAAVSARGTIASLGVRTSVQLSGRLTATTLTVDSVGLLTMQGQVAGVSGNVVVTQQGGIRMSAAPESLLVAGSASFGGAIGCVSTMTAGVLRVSGGLTVPVNTGLCGSGTHTTELPSSGAQSVAGVNGTFGNLVLGPIATPAAVTFGPSSSWSVQGRLIVRSGVTSVLGPAAIVSIGTALVDTVGGRWQVNGTAFSTPGVVEVPSAFGVAGGLVQVVAPGNVSLVRQGGAGPISLAGSLTVSDGTLDFGAQTVTVAEDLLTTVTGRLRMVDPAGSLSVRNAIFGGASTAGLLLAGQLSVSGTLSQQNTTSDSSFAASPGHVLRLVGAAPQDVSFATPGASAVGRLDIAATGNPAVLFASNIVARDSVRLVAGTGVVAASVAGSRLLLQGTALRDPSVTLKRWQVPVTVQAALAQLPDTVGASVTLAAPVTLGGTNPWRRVRGALVIAAGGQLTMNGTTFVVNDSLAVRGTGARLVMTQGLDSLDVGAAVVGGGGATFDGDDHTGSLTNGALVVRGRFRQLAATSARSFVASGTHRLIKFCPAATAACDAATSTDTLHFATGGVGQSVVQSLTIANGSGTQRTATTLAGVVTVNGVYAQIVGAGVVRPATGVSTLRLAGASASIERLIPTVLGGTVLQPRLLEVTRGLPVSKPLTGVTVVQPETLAVVGAFGSITENTTVLDATVPWLRISTTGGTSTFPSSGTPANVVNVSVDGTGAAFGVTLPSFGTQLTGELRTSNNGAIVQSGANSQIRATNVTIAGGISTMTAGDLFVTGNFSVTGTGRYVATAPHTTNFDGDVLPQVVGPMPFDTLQSSFGNLRFFTVNGGPSDSITSSLPIRGYLLLDNNRLAGSNAVLQVRDSVIVQNFGRIVGRGGLVVTTPGLVRAVGTADSLAADTVVAEGSLVSQVWTNNGGPLRNVRVTKPAGVLRFAGSALTLTEALLVSQGAFKADSFQTVTARTLRTLGSGGIQGITAGIPPAAPTFSVDSAVFSGGPSPINAGALTVRRAFAQSGAANSYQAGVQWLTSFAGALPKTVAFATPGAGQSYFTGLQLSGNRSVQLLTDMRVENATGISAQSPNDTLLLNGRRLTVVGNLNVQGAIPFDGVGGTVEVQGALGMLTGGTFAPDTFVQSGVARTITRGVGATFRNVVVATTSGLGSFASTTDSLLGSLIVRGAAANLTLQNDTITTLTVAGDLITEAGGSFNMARPVGGVGTRTVIVRGNASFGGGSSSLVSGTLEVRGNFTQSGPTATAFAADSFHVTLLRPSGPARTVSFANPGTLTSRFGFLQVASDLAVGQTVSLASNVMATGALTDSGAAGGQFRRLVGSGGTRTLTVRGLSMQPPLAGTLRRPRMLDSLIFDNVRLAVSGGSAVGDTLDRFTAFAVDLLPATLQDVQFVNLPTTGASWLDVTTRSTLAATLVFNRVTFAGTPPTLPTSYVRMTSIGTAPSLTTTITNAVPLAPLPTPNYYFTRGTGTLPATWNGVVVP